MEPYYVGYAGQPARICICVSGQSSAERQSSPLQVQLMLVLRTDERTSPMYLAFDQTSGYHVPPTKRPHRHCVSV